MVYCITKIDNHFPSHIGHFPEFDDYLSAWRFVQRANFLKASSGSPVRYQVFFAQTWSQRVH